MSKEIAIQIQGKERTVSELLKSKKYSIDYYQREYRWETKHITELIEDLVNKFFSYYDKKHTLPQVGNMVIISLAPLLSATRKAKTSSWMGSSA
jgi:hypothetical protein